MSAKKTVFVSHITAEAELAAAVKSLIEDSFLGLVSTFVSSDSIGSGEKWVDQITAALRDCSVEIIVASPASVVRPWINFEAGSGWVRNIPVVPLCHSGMTPSTLPIPMSLLQASLAGDEAGVQSMLRTVAQALGSNTPKVDLAPFVATVRRLEEQYTFWNRANACLSRLRSVLKVPNLWEQVAKNEGSRLKIQITETQIHGVEALAGELSSLELLAFTARDGGMKIEPSGTTYGCSFEILSKLRATISDARFTP